MSGKRNPGKSRFPLLKAGVCAAVEFLYPPVCLLCQNERNRNDPWFCDGHRRLLDTNHADRFADACDVCGQNRKLRSCTCEKESPSQSVKIISLLDFDETVKQVVHQIKYGNRQSVGACLITEYLSMELTGLLNAMDMIVPVPLHWTRRIKRGYNQAEVLAKACAKATGVYTRLRADLLARKRGTRTQTTLDRDSRRRNLSGAFVLKESHREQIANKRICIVDDVITTGATVGACANELIKAGALQVMALSLARA